MSEPICDFLTDAQVVNVLTGKKPVKKGEWRFGFRAVHADFRSRDGFRYPWPGGWAEAPGPILQHKGSCPQAQGDGLCVAKNLYGAGLGGIPLGTLLIVAFTNADVLGEAVEKLRVKRMYVAEVLGIARVLPIIAKHGADLRGANLRGADLYGADLRGANLYRADLYGALNTEHAYGLEKVEGTR